MEGFEQKNDHSYPRKDETNLKIQEKLWKIKWKIVRKGSLILQREVSNVVKNKPEEKGTTKGRGLYSKYNVRIVNIFFTGENE